MAERVLIFLNTYGYPEEVVTTTDSFTIGQVTISSGPVLSNTGINMQDTNISGVNNIAFTDLNGTIAGIENQNLLDKTADETITATTGWTFNTNISFDSGTRTIAGIQNQNLLDKTADETITAPTGWAFNTNISFDSGTRTIAGIQNQNLVDKTAAESISGIWDFTTGITVPNSPLGDSYAVNKFYVDTVVQGLNPKDSVKAATTAEITLSGAQTIDGVSVIAGDRVLVKNQTTDASENGIYIVSATTWSRSPDANSWDELVSAFVFVEEGTANGDTGWVCTVDAGGTIDVDPVTWVQFSGAGTYTAGHGLDLVGTEFSVDVTDIIDITAGLTETGGATSQIQVKLETDGGIVFDGTNGGIEINVDNSTVEISTNTLRVKANGITNTELDNAGNFTVTGNWNFSGAEMIIPTAAPATNSNGNLYWDSKVLYIYDTVSARYIPVGSGNIDILTAGENIGDGEVVRWSASDTVVKALADNATNALRTIGLADEAITSAATGVIKINGVKELTGWGLTPGSTYYLSSTVAGAMVTSPPAGGGNWIIKLGLALSATRFMIDIDVLGRRA